MLKKYGYQIIYAYSIGSPGKSTAQDPQEDPGLPIEASDKEAKHPPSSRDLSFNRKCNKLDGFNPSTNSILSGERGCHRRERDEEPAPATLDSEQGKEER